MEHLGVFLSDAVTNGSYTAAQSRSRGNFQNQAKRVRRYFFPALHFVHLALFAALIRARPAAEM
jgi:hypothetical protein